jgi:hypothetical protein
MSQKLINALYTKLTLDQTSGSLYDDLGGRVYFGKAPDNSSLPLLIFDLITSDVQNSFGGSRVDTARFQIDLYGSIKLGAVAIGNIETKLFSLIDSVTITATDYDNVSVACASRSQRSMGDEAHRIVSEYELIGSAS